MDSLKKKVSRKVSIGLLIAMMLLTSQCTILEIQNSSAGTDRVLASKEAECESIERRHWSVLYGTVPISFLNSNIEDSFDGKTFRIKEKAGILDFVISIVGGFSTSITAKTIVIENCDSGKISKPQVETKSETKVETE